MAPRSIQERQRNERFARRFCIVVGVAAAIGSLALPAPRTGTLTDAVALDQPVEEPVGIGKTPASQQAAAGASESSSNRASPTSLARGDEAANGDAPAAAAASDYSRKHHDLITLFRLRPDQVATGDLVRHVKLNPIDHRFSKDQARPLEAIVAKHVAIVSPLIKARRTSDADERAELIQSGRVMPAQLPRPSDAAIERFARQVSRDAADCQSLLDAWRKDPPIAAMQGLDHFNCNGKTYLVRDFPPLERTRALREELRLRCVDFLGEVGLWFCQQGVLSDQDFGKLLERLRASAF